MLYPGDYNHNSEADDYVRDLTWIDYLVASNPQGVMKVLANYGYIGYLAPQDETEMTEVAYDLVSKQDDQAVIDLLKVHPLFDVISDICKEETVVKVPFRNASGETSFFTTINTINYSKLIENLLLIVGIFFVADNVFQYITKSD